MRNVISDTATSKTLKVSQCTEYSYYGVDSGSAKGFITREDFQGGDYTVRAVKSLTEANGWSDYDSRDITKVISSLLANDFKVVEFGASETKKFFQWLAE